MAVPSSNSKTNLEERRRLTSTGACVRRSEICATVHVVLDRIDDRIASTLSQITRHLPVFAADLIGNVTHVGVGVWVPQAVILRVTERDSDVVAIWTAHKHLAGESDRQLSAMDNIVAQLTWLSAVAKLPQSMCGTLKPLRLTGVLN